MVSGGFRVWGLTARRCVLCLARFCMFPERKRELMLCIYMAFVKLLRRLFLRWGLSEGFLVWADRAPFPETLSWMKPSHEQKP